MVAELGRVFWEGGSIVMIRRTLDRICGVEIWDSESSRGSEPLGRCTEVQGQVLGSTGNGTPEQKADFNTGSGWEK